jgi:5-methyltetrahydropteroyltriglutamate--homocysteine methyltransferase
MALEGKPADMVITTHVCRGNFRSTWISEGGYEPVAETLLAKLNYDGYFLEYDTARAGGFEPLRFLPKGNKIVVLGLVTTKNGALEKKDAVKRRIEEATKFGPFEQLCLSPQCGFASTEEGNVLAEDEEWAKLRMIVELADEVWG